MDTNLLDFSDYDEQSQLELQQFNFLSLNNLKKEALNSENFKNLW